MGRPSSDWSEDVDDVRISWRPVALALLGALLLTAAFIVGLRAGAATAPRGPAAWRESPAPAMTGGMGGATRSENGVPAGYPRTIQGAVAAATDFTMILGGPLILQPDRYRAAVATMSAPSWRDRRLTAAEDAIAAFQNSSQLVSAAARGMTVVMEQVPVAYMVARYSDQNAQVSIWGLSLIGADGLLSPQENWGTATLSLEWVAGDWRLTDLAATAGPYPVAQSQSTQTTTLPPQLKAYRRYANAPAG